MRNPFDRLIKLLTRKGFSPAGHVETEAEVSPDSLRIDIWFWPDAARARRVLRPLGLFGRLGRTSCTIEAHHCTPSGEEVLDDVMKHRFFCRELSRRTPPPPAPRQWILSSGKPSSAIAGLRFRASRWGKGIYDGPPLTRTTIIAINELPRTQDTLLVRILGAGRTLRQAIADLRALPKDDPMRRLAVRILVQLRLEIPTDPAKQTPSDREFLMTMREVDRYLKQLHKDGLEKGREEGLEKGRAEALAGAVLDVYRLRFGAPPPALTAAVKGAADYAELKRWHEIVVTGSADDVAAALRRSHKKQPARVKAKRRVSAGRAEAAR